MGILSMMGGSRGPRRGNPGREVDQEGPSDSEVISQYPLEDPKGAYANEPGIG
jgi:hypothetical protein